MSTTTWIAALALALALAGVFAAAFFVALFECDRLRLAGAKVVERSREQRSELAAERQRRAQAEKRSDRWKETAMDADHLVKRFSSYAVEVSPDTLDVRVIVHRPVVEAVPDGVRSAFLEVLSEEVARQIRGERPARRTMDLYEAAG